MDMIKLGKTFFAGMLVLTACGCFLSPTPVHAQDMERSTTESESTQMSGSSVYSNDIIVRELIRRQREQAGIREIDIGAALARREEKNRNDLLLRLSPLVLLLIAAILRSGANKENSTNKTKDEDKDT